MYILNIENAIKMMMKDLRVFIFATYYKLIGFDKKMAIIILGKVRKDLALFATKLQRVSSVVRKEKTEFYIYEPNKRNSRLLNI